MEKDLSGDSSQTEDFEWSFIESELEEFNAIVKEIEETANRKESNLIKATFNLFNERAKQKLQTESGDALATLKSKPALKPKPKDLTIKLQAMNPKPVRGNS